MPDRPGRRRPLRPLRAATASTAWRPWASASSWCWSAAIACWFCTAVAGYFVLQTGREQDDLAFAPHPPTADRAHGAADAALQRGRRGRLRPAGRARRLAGPARRLGRLRHLRAQRLAPATRSIVAERAAFCRCGRWRTAASTCAAATKNPERKAGNVADWVRRFGGAYEFMVVLDADSTMAGDTLLRLVDAMQRNPGVGLIQTAPTITGAATLFARMSQFGVRMYGRVAAAGLAWWAGAEASYWGHNAIVRTRAFAAGRRPADPAGRQAVRRPRAEPRRGRGRPAAPRRLGGACHRRPGRQLRGDAADAHRLHPARPPLVPGQPAAPAPARRARACIRSAAPQLGMGAMAYLSSPLWFAGLAIGLAPAAALSRRLGRVLVFPARRSFTPFMLTSLLSGVLLIGPKLLGCAPGAEPPGRAPRLRRRARRC